MNDDVFDFFYEALPGYEEVGRRRILLGCWGAFNNPKYVDYDYRNMDDWGNEMFVTPGVVVDGELVTTNLVDINLGIRILLGSSYYEDWQNEETFVDKDPLGNPVDKRHPWNQTTIPKPQKRDLDGGNYSWVMSPRWYDKRTGDYLALDTGGGALARLWATALANKVHTPFVNATGDGVTINLPKTPNTPDATLEWKIPKWSNAIERDRARIYFVAYAAGMAMHFLNQGLDEVRAGNTKVFEDFDVPEEGIGCGFHEAVRGVLSHHMVIRNGKIANYHPYPPTPWNGSPTDSFGTPGPYEDAVMGQPIFEENGPDEFRGIDIMRAVRSFDPCLPCGVHMYLGGGKTLKTVHSPMFGAQHGLGRRPWTTCRHGSWSRGWTPSWRRSRPSPTRRPATRRPSWWGRSSTCTGTGSPGWWRGSPSRRRSARTRSSRICCCCTASIPVPIEARVRTALEEVRPYLDSHGGNVELVAVEDGTVRLRMEGSCSGCPSSAVTLKLAIEDAIRKHAPDVGEIEAEDAEPEGLPMAPAPALIELAPRRAKRQRLDDRRFVAAAALRRHRPEGHRRRAGAVPARRRDVLCLPPELPRLRALARGRRAAGRAARMPAAASTRIPCSERAGAWTRPSSA